MSKTSNPVLKDGLGIVARLVVIAMLLGVLSTMLQGCSGAEATSANGIDHQQLTVSVEKALETRAIALF